MLLQRAMGHFARCKPSAAHELLHILLQYELHLALTSCYRFAHALESTLSRNGRCTLAYDHHA
jgi:hypothetical protein